MLAIARDTRLDIMALGFKQRPRFTLLKIDTFQRRERVIMPMHIYQLTAVWSPNRIVFESGIMLSETHRSFVAFLDKELPQRLKHNRATIWRSGRKSNHLGRKGIGGYRYCWRWRLKKLTTVLNLERDFYRLSATQPNSPYFTACPINNFIRARHPSHAGIKAINGPGFLHIRIQPRHN